MESELASQTPLPELVRDARLQATIEAHITTHTRQLGHRAMSRYESWAREQLLGHGGNGVVWLERKVKDDGSPVELRAVKCIRVSDNQPKSKSMKYVRELEALAKFSQKKYADFFVECYGWYKSREWLHVAMEYCERGDLGKYLADMKTIPEDQTQRIASQILGALTLMHKEEFSHRDLKPANILIKRKPPEPWWVKLCDFGLSKRSEYIMGLTTVQATPGFMPPETIGNLFRGDPKTANPFYVDMWCFGETCHQTLTGQATFKDQRNLYDFHLGGLQFPDEALRRAGASEEAINFIQLLMLPTPWQRLSTDKAWEHQWIKVNTKPASRVAAPTPTSQDPIPTTDDQLTQASGQFDVTTTQPRPMAGAHLYQTPNPAQRIDGSSQLDLAQINDMDAQNAAQSDQTRPAGDSPRRPDPKPETTKSIPPPVSPTPSEPVDKDKEPRQPANSSSAPDVDAPEDRDSDAETIVLPEKHQSSIIARGDPIKKKRLSAHLEREKQSRGKDAASSGLSSAPASPPQHRRQHRRRSDDPHSSSDSEYSRPRPSKTSIRDKLKSTERLVPHKRKGLRLESDDEADSRKVRRQQTTSVGIDSGRLHKEHKALSGKSHHESQNRSISPQSRSHRRSASSQLPSYSSNGSGQKRRRLPPPLYSTEYHSDESSTSGSPHPRSFKLRSLAMPATADTNASPARIAPYKKHLNAHGQTFLARACAKGDYKGAKTRLMERPEDLNIADYAGNTPLQIAAINGCEDIVELLIKAGCDLDCINYDKDTPLLDAVDNGHLGVVKLLLDAGVNPRKANMNREEPVDRVSEKTENADEIRAALMAARKRVDERRCSSEERSSHYDSHDATDSHALDSPRNSAVINQQGRRSGTVRAQKTRNDLLYMPLDEKTLRQAAGRGDEETVARILQVKEGFNDPESMVAAARGGHDLVIQLLLSLGAANPDPAPISSVQPEFATPILAAIGQENIKVVELLLEQQGFDPTRRFKGETYYEIARRRAGSNWKEEEHMLKNAYDDYKRNREEQGRLRKARRQMVRGKRQQ